MYNSLEKIIEISERENTCFWKLVQEDDCRERGISPEESLEQMREMYRAMKEADLSYDAKLRSTSGLVGSEGEKMKHARKNQTLLCGDFIGKVMEKALKMGESNACMRRIVAAPTAGSCGVLPAVFLSVAEDKYFPEEKMVQALYVSAGIGGVIANRAFIAGAAGGCQAEIGTASAMAAGGVTYLMGGNARAIANAAALSLKNFMGLVCDPVAGLVEVPCVKRNVMGAVNALVTADESMAGIFSKIPADEVIDAMRAVGRSMPENLKETGTGGIAATPTAIHISERLNEKEEDREKVLTS